MTPRGFQVRKDDGNDWYILDCEKGERTYFEVLGLVRNKKNASQTKQGPSRFKYLPIVRGKPGPEVCFPELKSEVGTETYSDIPVSVSMSVILNLNTG